MFFCATLARKKTMDNFEQKAAYCTLGRIFGFEPSVGMRLVEAAGSAEAIFSMGDKALDSLLGPYCKFRHMLTSDEFRKSEDELQGLAAKGCRFISAAEEGYPPLLLECPDAPLGLYVKSVSEPAEIFCSRPSVSVVGTRDMSMYGREWCRRIVEALAGCRRQPAIVSGLAIGVDITAHTAALELGIPDDSGPADIHHGSLSGQTQGLGCKDCGDSRLRPRLRLPSRSHTPACQFPQAQQDHCRVQPGHSACGIERQGWRADNRQPGLRVLPGCLRPAWQG